MRKKTGKLTDILITLDKSGLNMANNTSLLNILISVQNRIENIESNVLDINNLLQNHYAQNLIKLHKKRKSDSYQMFSGRTQNLYKFIVHEVKNGIEVVSLDTIQESLKISRANAYMVIKRLRDFYNKAFNKKDNFNLLKPLRNDRCEYEINKEFIETIKNTKEKK